MTDPASRRADAAPTLSLDGYTPLPPGKIAAVVTYLEMMRPPSSVAEPRAGDDVTLTPFEGGTEAYQALFRAVGEPWLWVSRLAMPDAKLAAIIADPAVAIRVARRDGRALGFLEVDARAPDETELAFLGVVPDAIGSGLGRRMMSEAIRLAFARPIRRLFVHTCTFDHPDAVAFYVRSGFRACARAIEVIDDPRSRGLLDPAAGAARWPVIA